MIAKIDKLISYSFYSLFFFVPFAVYSKTSELFEFNKMVLVYALTALIVTLWIAKMSLSQKVNFKRTLLDVFLIIFFLSQLAATLISVDVRTSIFGYYSRFHGGLLSTISYTLLYWAYVSNMNYEKTKRAIYFTFGAAFLVCIWAILEHFGKSFSCLIFQEFGTFDVSCWVQDVQNRVYATFGQPNWLAAWIVALMPITWAFALTSKERDEKKNWKVFLWPSLSVVFFITLLYTKSRSGILAFLIITIIFWSATFFTNIKNKTFNSGLAKNFTILNSLFLILFLVIGTPWTPNLSKILNKNPEPITNHESQIINAPALEVGGTESGEIRKIVWKGAFDMWKNNPIFGTGVETFAYSYYKYRPVEHNLVSEWNFLYNKAHNEYLNIAATTGTVGILLYLALILFSLLQIMNYLPAWARKLRLFSKNPKSKIQNPNYKLPITNYKESRQQEPDATYLRLALFAGFISILITNFFGFSVVAVSLQFFLFPAMAMALAKRDKKDEKQSEITDKFSNSQIIPIFFALCFLLFAWYSIGKYWYADTVYTRGKLENDSGLFTNAITTLQKAIKFSPNESVYWDELASATSRLALLYAENDEVETAAKIAKSAVNEGSKAISLNPANVVIKKSQAQMLANLGAIDPVYLERAKLTLLDTLKLAPTDAQIIYNLAIIYYKTGDNNKFYDYLKKTVEMKPNYKKAHFNLALFYTNQGDIEAAKNEYRYILENIGPDKSTEEELVKLENGSE